MQATLTQASLADLHGLVSPDVRRHEEHGAFGEHGRAQHHAEGEKVDEQLEELERDGHRARHHRLVLVTRRRHYEHVPPSNVVPAAGKSEHIQIQFFGRAIGVVQKTT